jgi:hypothetical protein
MPNAKEFRSTSEAPCALRRCDAARLETEHDILSYIEMGKQGV